MIQVMRKDLVTAPSLFTPDHTLPLPARERGNEVNGQRWSSGLRKEGLYAFDGDNKLNIKMPFTKFLYLLIFGGVPELV